MANNETNSRLRAMCTSKLEATASQKLGAVTNKRQIHSRDYVSLNRPNEKVYNQ